MSIFKEIKGTIQSVQQDISSSIKSLASSGKEKERGKGSNVRARSQSFRGQGVSLDAGADLLHRYQEKWSELHQQAEENATEAENTAIIIGSLFLKINQQSRSLAQLSEEAQGLPTILQQLQDLTNQIARVEELCEQVEAAEVQLENVCEEEEFKQAQGAHHMQLVAYRQKKQAAADKHIVELAQEHARNVRERDIKRQSQLKERQSIFQEAFDKDINYYRTFGKTERQPSVEKGAASVDLADIKIEDEPGALDNFLESADITPVSDRPQVLTEDELPEDEDSGVIYDDNESPERLSHDHSANQSHNRTTSVNNGSKSSDVNDQRTEENSKEATIETETDGETTASGNASCDTLTADDVKTSTEKSGDLIQPDINTQNVENLASELAKAELVSSNAESVEASTESDSKEQC